MRTPVIVSAVRTPTGRFLGGLKALRAPELGAVVIREAVRRAGVDPAAVDECLFGNVLTAGVGQNPARQAAIAGGLPDHVAAVTVNKVCGSGLKAVMFAAQAIRAGDGDVLVAGGMESMSNAPYLLPKGREGLRLGHAELIDSLIADGLWCAFENWHMGSAAEHVAAEYRVSREAQDAYAVESHRRAALAAAEGQFAAELVPIEVRQAKGDFTIVGADESIRPDTSVERLRFLKPAFKNGGTVTAGNAPGVNDGAAALVLMSEERAVSLDLAPMARIVGYATSGLAPKEVLMAPVESILILLEKVGWTREDVDLFEINEAFAAQLVAVIGELHLDPAKVNVNGGAIALGHPIGASGARILTTLVHAMAARGARRGVAALCLGGGNGVALAVER